MQSFMDTRTHLERLYIHGLVFFMSEQQFIKREVNTKWLKQTIVSMIYVFNENGLLLN